MIWIAQKCGQIISGCGDLVDFLSLLLFQVRNPDNLKPSFQGFNFILNPARHDFLGKR